jgi:hypothetical protein
MTVLVYEESKNGGVEIVDAVASIRSLFPPKSARTSHVHTLDVIFTFHAFLAAGPRSLTSPDIISLLLSSPIALLEGCAGLRGSLRRDRRASPFQVC